MKKYFILFTIIFVLFSCSEFQRLLKSGDPELKYTRAVEFFERGDYMRAQTLFYDVRLYFRGTDRAESLLFYVARTYLGQRDFVTAGERFRDYVRIYPNGRYVQEARFLIGYSFYRDSPDPRLDQTSTKRAIAEFQEFIDVHPENERVPEANALIDEMMNKLAFKELLNARLYYRLGTHLGNNYLSAVIVAQNALRNFPTTRYREDLSMVILEAKFKQAVLSVAERRQERYTETLDEAYSFINEFPDGRHRRQADRILREARRALDRFN